MSTALPPDAEPRAARRRFIRLAGGGAVLAALPLAGCSTDSPAEAVQAWHDDRETTDLRVWMLRHALLAPNPHNRQSWIADLRTPGEITLVCDGTRLLPETDPFGRQVLIGCGAFIELAVMAAAERGRGVRVELFPEGAPGPRVLPEGNIVARLSVGLDTRVPKDPLFAQVRRRHTHKGPFATDRPVAAPAWQALTAAATADGLQAGAVTDGAGLAALRRITREAFEAEMLTPRTCLESGRLMRIGPGEVAQHRDGIALMDHRVRVLSSLGLFDRLAVPERGSFVHRQTMERWSVWETGSGYLWISSRDNSRGLQVVAGRAYVRAHLAATAAGVDLHPLSQALQEYEEVRPQFEALRAQLRLDAGDTTVQMLARVGYGVVRAGPSPRRDLQALIRA